MFFLGHLKKKNVSFFFVSSLLPGQVKAEFYLKSSSADRHSVIANQVRDVITSYVYDTGKLFC